MLFQRYLEIAERTGGPILELGDGGTDPTSAAIPLARAGYRVAFVDISGGALEQLQQLHEELDREAREVGQRVHVLRDIAKLKFVDRDFSLAILPGASPAFGLRNSRALATAARHLAPGGVLALERVDRLGVELESMLENAGLELTSIDDGAFVTATKK